MQRLLRVPERIGVVVASDEQHGRVGEWLEKTTRDRQRKIALGFGASTDCRPVQTDYHRRQRESERNRFSPPTCQSDGPDARPQADGPEAEHKEVVAFARLTLSVRR